MSPAAAAGLGLGAAVLAVHLLWRVDTLFVPLTPGGAALSFALFAMESFLALALAATALARLLPASIRVDPEAVPESELPTVDIFILVESDRQAPKAAWSLAATAQLDYPRGLARTHLVAVDRACDDEGPLQALAAKMKASWLTASPEASAGAAINAALTRTAGSLVLILRAGEAPVADLIRRIAGAFVNQPRLALCDVPMFAVDADPVLADLDVTRRMPGDPGAFLKTCLKAVGRLSPFGLSQGTVWRRAALAASGACARTAMRPDASARFRAAQSGWIRGAVDRPMVAFVAPDSVAEHLRTRLAARIGTIDVALARGPLFARGLSLRERLSWLPGIFAAISPLVWTALFGAAPLAVLLGIPLYGDGPQVLSLIMPVAALCSALAMAGMLHSGLRDLTAASWSEALESLLSGPALLTLMRRHDRPDNVPEPEHASGLLVVLFALGLAGTAAGVATWAMRPELHPALGGPLALTLLVAALVACLLGAVAEPRQRRLSPRVARRFQAELLLGGARYSGRLADISVHGAKFVADDLVELSARALAGRISLDGPNGKTSLPVQLSRSGEDQGCSTFGLAFAGRTVADFAAVVRLAHRSGDAWADLCDRRARPPGIAGLFASLGWRGVASFLRRFDPPVRNRHGWIPIRRMSRTMH